MTVSINRTGREINLIPKTNQRYGTAFQISDEYGYNHVSALDIENCNEVSWDGIEFNRLLTKDGVLYRFVRWIGEYPFSGIIIEEIGTVERFDEKEANDGAL